MAFYEGGPFKKTKLPKLQELHQDNKYLQFSQVKGGKLSKLELECKNVGLQLTIHRCIQMSKES